MFKCEFCQKESKSKAGLVVHQRKCLKVQKVQGATVCAGCNAAEGHIAGCPAINPAENQSSMGVPQEKPFEGIVGDGHILPPPPKVKPELPKPGISVTFQKGDKVRNINTGDVFIVENVEGTRIARRVNQTPEGIKWYEKETLMKLL